MSDEFLVTLGATIVFVVVIVAALILAVAGNYVIGLPS